MKRRTAVLTTISIVLITILVIGIVLVVITNQYNTDPYNRYDPYLGNEQLNLEITNISASQMTVEANNTVYSTIKVSKVTINDLPVAIEPFIASSNIPIIINLPGTFVNGTDYTVVFTTKAGCTFETSAIANFS